MVGRRLGLSIELLWPLIALSPLAFLGSLTLIVPHDFWWHMQIGEVISEQRQIPTTDVYSFTRAGVPIVYQSWLSQLMLDLLYRLGGLSLILIIRNILLVVSYALVAWQAYKRSGSWRLAALGVAAAGMLALNNWTVRPQTFSWLPFMFCWTILAGYTGGWLRGRWLIALPLIELLWANLHGAFTLGLALTGIIAFGESISKLASGGFFDVRRAEPRPASSSALLRPVGPLWLSLAAMVLATLANPRGAGLYSYVMTLLTNPPSQSLIVEWQPPVPSHPSGFLFFASLALVLLVWLRKPAAGRLSDLLVLLAFTWLALGGVRYVIWYAMVLGPILAQLLASGRPSAAPARRETPLQRRLNLLLALVLFLPAVWAQPPLRGSLPMPDVFRGSLAPVPDANLVTANTPLQAAGYLREHYTGDRLYHEMSYGSYLIWAFEGSIPVFVDTRIELYPLDLWMDYRRIAAGCDYNALLQKYQIDTLLLDREGQKRLLQRIADDPIWQQVYEDKQSVIYRRTAMALAAPPAQRRTASGGYGRSAIAEASRCKPESVP